MSDPLKSCPFCSGPVEVAFATIRTTRQPDRGIYHVVCHACEAEGPSRATRQEAAEAWDRRAEAGGWVPVGERLPEPGHLVAVLLHGNVTAAFLARDGSWSLHWRDRAGAEEVAMWHLLPEPPGEQGG